MLLRSPQPLGRYPRCLGEYLEHWGKATPDAVFLSQREASGAWRPLNYGDALTATHAIGASLLSRKLGAQRPVMILSGNSIEHALLTLGAMHVGVPVAPVSPAYSLMSKAFGQLRSIATLLKPGLVYAADAGTFRRAIDAVDWGDAELVLDQLPDGIHATPFSALANERPGRAVSDAFSGVTPDTIAKILFTSGSTGEPKGVINTQRMLVSNQQAIAQLWPFLAEAPLVLCDWLPWNHTFGANHNFNMVLRHGGALYIDDGKPAPGLIDKTVANLREISPTIYFNVPRGFDMLIPHLENDPALRRNFFRRLRLIFYAGAALPPNLWSRLEALSVGELGARVSMVSGWGSTETAPMATTVHFEIDRPGIIGLPAPGCELKMLPAGGKLELRVRGPNVTPGYWKRDDLTRAAFDEEGFYRIGDAGKFFNPREPSRGIVFDGRVAEDFKLTSGIWVHVGALRVRAIAALEPVAQDIVVAGHDRDEIGLLIFPSPACRRLAGLHSEAPIGEVMRHAAVRQCVRDGLAKLAGESSGSSMHATRALLLEEPPNIDANEITDKGYINQRAVIERRAALVEKLYAASVPDEVITLDR